MGATTKPKSYHRPRPCHRDRVPFQTWLDPETRKALKIEAVRRGVSGLDLAATLIEEGLSRAVSPAR